MPHTPSKFIPAMSGIVLAVLCVAGCRSADSKAQRAYADYETAIAANDLPSARKALLTLVNVQDDVADNWVELGKLQTSLGAYGDAQYAFTRAYELNRRDPDILRAVTQLNLRGGDFATAQIHARELELLSPSDPWIKLVDGYVALSESRWDQALVISNSMLAASPFDSNGKVLKARALIGQGKFDDALSLLVDQVAAQPKDVGALQLIEKIYEQRSDWPKVADAARRLDQLDPGKRDISLLLISASLRAGLAGQAREVSLKLLKPAADASLITSVLDIWADYWPSPQRVTDARALGAVSQNREARLAYAAFLNRVNDPASAIALVGTSATLPVTAENVQANAVLADAFSRNGRIAEASRLFDLVLSYDSGNATALRGRAELRLRTGRPKYALPDAQKLVSVITNSARDRLLLARCYDAAGNSLQAQNSLWDGFHDIPASEALFAALKARSQSNADAVASLSEEYTQQRSAELYRGIL